MDATDFRSVARQRGRYEVPAALVGLVIGGAAGWYAGQQGVGAGALPTATPTVAPVVASAPAAAPRRAPVAIVAHYDFEADRPIGWGCGKDEEALACVGVSHANELHREGLTSLKFDLNLTGGHARRGSGEIWVDVAAHAPIGMDGPLNLSGRTLSAWIYAAPGGTGDPSRPNGVQLFVKDGDWTPQYGPWQDIQEGQWSRVEFPISGAGDFNPAQINAIGLKVAAGDGSKATFRGPIYVDAIGW